MNGVREVTGSIPVSAGAQTSRRPRRQADNLPSSLVGVVWVVTLIRKELAPEPGYRRVSLVYAGQCVCDRLTQAVRQPLHQLVLIRVPARLHAENRREHE